MKERETLIALIAKLLTIEDQISVEEQLRIISLLNDET